MRVIALDEDFLHLVCRSRLAGTVIHCEDAVLEFLVQENGRQSVVGVPKSQAFQAICTALPTCYGTIAIPEPLPPRDLTDPVLAGIREMAFRIWRDERHIEISKLPQQLNSDACRDWAYYFEEGGSSSNVLLIQDEDGAFVRKFARDGGIEGNGIPKLIAERRFLERLGDSTVFSDLAGLYPRIAGYPHCDDRDYAFFDMEYIRGRNTNACLDDGSLTPNRLFILLGRLLDTIIPRGFMQAFTVPDPGALESLYTERATARVNEIRRLAVAGALAQEVPMIRNLDALFGESLVVNGVTCAAPGTLLAKLRSGFRPVLQPRGFWFNVHGDATLVNMIYEPSRDRLRLVDPRGHFGVWDPLYDFGKMLMSLLGHYHAAIGRIEVEQQGDDAFVVRLIGEDEAVARFAETGASFPDFLSQHTAFRTLVADEPHWRTRLEFAAAIHLLADVPFKLHSRTPKEAIAIYLLGVLRLNHVAKALERRL